MALGAEAFTILAILEARDRASEIFDKVDEALGKFSETASSAADAAKGAGDEIDESLLSTASGADALEVATAKVAAAQAKAAGAADAQAQAEQRLLAVTSQGVASEEEQAAAATELAAAQGRAAEAQALATEASSAQSAALAALAAESAEGSAAAGLYADANGKLRNSAGQFVSAADAQEIAVRAVSEAEDAGSTSADALAAASDRVAAAQKAAADASAEVAAAQARQAGLVTADTQVTAAQNLAKAEKTAQSASSDLTATQKTQAATQKALAASTDEAKAAAEAEASAQKQAAADSEASAKFLSSAGKIAGVTAIGMGVAAAVMVKAAGNFQNSTTHLVTDAGESSKKLGMVQAGILNISTATGTSAAAITDAMYHIESGGFHAQTGLDMAKVAAEGAKVGGADLDTVSKTLVGTMNAYYGSTTNASNATQRSTSVMEEMIATVGSGDMRMQDLASSLSSVAPLAAKAGISLAQVGGAIATMTAQGMTARQATQDLSHTISSLENPTAVQTNEMAQLGLSSQKVASQLGSKGLTGTISTLTGAITSHMGKSGQVIMSAFNQSTSAAQDANLMLSKLPASIQGVAKAYLDGSASYTTFNTATKGVGLQARTLADQFATTAGKAHGFNSLLTSGQPGVQTYTAALAKMTGGQTGLKTALMLTGENAGTFAANVAKISAAGKGATTLTQGWAAIQGTFNQKIAVAKTAVENTGIAIGSALLPAVSAIVSAVGKVLIPVAEFTAKHKTLTLVVFAGVTAFAALVAVLALTAKIFKTVKGAVDEVKSAVNGATALMRKLGLISKQTADTQKKAATDAADTQEAKAEEAAGVQEEQSAEAAAAQEADAGEVAAANETAATESSAGWIAGAAKTVASWAVAGVKMIASAAKWVVEGGLKVAAYVAENVFGAEATASAWTLANAAMLLGIGLVIAAVVIAVVEIVKHWNTITSAVSKVWDAVYAYVSKVIGDVISFIKSHWVLIVSIITGPLGLAVIEIVKHWDQIKSFISTAVNDVINFVKSHWRLIISVLGGPLGLAVALVTKYWNDIKHWFTEGVNTVLSILRGLAGDVVSVGGDIVRGIWRGISGMGGWLWGQVKNFASNTLHSFESALGIGSPSKYTTVHGQMLGLGLAGGIISSIPKAVAAARQMTGSVLAVTTGMSSRSGAAGIGSSLAASAVGPASGSANGGVTVVVNVTGNTVIGDSDIQKLTNAIGKKLSTTVLPAAGRKLNIRG